MLIGDEPVCRGNTNRLMLEQPGGAERFIPFATGLLANRSDRGDARFICFADFDGHVASDQCFGNAGILLQVLLGGIAGAALAVKLFWHKILGLFGVGKRDHDEPLA